MPVTLSVPESERQRLLIFNLRTDIDDHILGFTTRWLNELALYYAHIDVLTTHCGRLAVADNVTVYSTGRERGYGRLQQLGRFYQVLSSLLLKNHYDACFAHMQPLFATLAAPLLAVRGVKLTTWYTHRQSNLPVEMAARWSYRIVSAVESSFPVQTAKLRPLGHGIDPEFYVPAPESPAYQTRLIQVARLTDIKHQHILLEAIHDLDCKVVFVGDIPDGYDDSYKKQLFQQVHDLGMGDRVIFAGAQNPEQVASWYQSAHIAINLSPYGLFDKAALEGMACGLPTIVSNSAFAPLLEPYTGQLLIPAPDDVDALRESLKQLLALSPEEHQQIGSHLRSGIVAHHSLSTLIIKLINVMHTGEI